MDTHTHTHADVLADETSMSADAERDGHPAECTWRPLLNAVDHSVKIMKTRN